MKNLKDFDFEDKVTDMVWTFAGIKDTEAICNIEINGRIVQVCLMLVEEDEPEFSDYKGIPLVEVD